MDKIILRMCIVTREKCDKNEMFRIVKDKNGNIIIDENGSIQGRGTYLKKDKDVILLAKKKNALSKGLRCNVPSDIYDQLLLKL